KWHSERCKEAGTDERAGAFQVFAGLGLITVDQDFVGPEIAAQKTEIEQAGCSDAWKRFKPSQQRVLKRSQTRRVRVFREIDIEQNDILSVEPGGQSLEVLQR